MCWFVFNAWFLRYPISLTGTLSVQLFPLKRFSSTMVLTKCIFAEEKCKAAESLSSINSIVHTWHYKQTAENNEACWPPRYLRAGFGNRNERGGCWVSGSIGTQSSARQIAQQNIPVVGQLMRKYCTRSLWQRQMVVWCHMVCCCFGVKTVTDSVQEKYCSCTGINPCNTTGRWFECEPVCVHVRL